MITESCRVCNDGIYSSGGLDERIRRRAGQAGRVVTHTKEKLNNDEGSSSSKMISMMSLESVKKDMTSTPTLGGEVCVTTGASIYMSGVRQGWLTPLDPETKASGPPHIAVDKGAKRRTVGNASNLTRIFIYTTRIRSTKVGSDEVNHGSGTGLPRA